MHHIMVENGIRLVPKKIAIDIKQVLFSRIKGHGYICTMTRNPFILTRTPRDRLKLDVHHKVTHFFRVVGTQLDLELESSKSKSIKAKAYQIP
jgi:hypothetical protein